MSRELTVAVVGATGLVGRTMIDILEERRFTSRPVVPVASERSRGRTLRVQGGEEVPVRVLDEIDFRGVDIALFSPGAAVSREHAPRAAAAGAVVIDNTSCFRYDDDVPLVVPEVNPHAIANCRRRNIIANPNCSTIQLVVALHPLHAHAGIERINVATYQAVSGAGQAALDALEEETAAVAAGRRPGGVPFAFNAVPRIDAFQDNGYTREEMKMFWETRKILEDERVQVNATAVRVPVRFGHGEAVHLETRASLDVATARRLLAAAPGVALVDAHDDDGFPTAFTHAAGADPVFVGRLRRDITHPRGLNLWIVADNVRKGAALNSVQIAEVLADSYW